MNKNIVKNGTIQKLKNWNFPILILNFSRHLCMSFMKKVNLVKRRNEKKERQNEQRYSLTRS